MNWGNKLILVFILFGGMISYMVYRCMQTPVDLVSASYYKEELAYQEVIDGTKAAGALSSRPGVVEGPEGIELRMPEEMKGRAVEGVVVFYCPSDQSRDRRVELRPDEDGRQLIGGGVVPAGSYTVKVSWRSSGRRYYSEQSMAIH
ncbi:MAG TPA: FixH family protein [Puia sp.]